MGLELLACNRSWKTVESHELDKRADVQESCTPPRHHLPQDKGKIQEYTESGECNTHVHQLRNQIRDIKMEKD